MAPAKRSRSTTPVRGSPRKSSPATTSTVKKARRGEKSVARDVHEWRLGDNAENDVPIAKDVKRWENDEDDSDSESEDEGTQGKANSSTSASKKKGTSITSTKKSPATAKKSPAATAKKKSPTTANKSKTVRSSPSRSPSPKPKGTAIKKTPAKTTSKSTTAGTTASKGKNTSSAAKGSTVKKNKGFIAEDVHRAHLGNAADSRSSIAADVRRWHDDDSDNEDSEESDKEPVSRRRSVSKSPTRGKNASKATAVATKSAIKTTPTPTMNGSKRGSLSRSPKKSTKKDTDSDDRGFIAADVHRSHLGDGADTTSSIASDVRRWHHDEDEEESPATITHRNRASSATRRKSTRSVTVSDKTEEIPIEKNGFDDGEDNDSDSDSKDSVDEQLNFDLESEANNVDDNNNRRKSLAQEAVEAFQWVAAQKSHRPIGFLLLGIVFICLFLSPIYMLESMRTSINNWSFTFPTTLVEPTTMPSSPTVATITGIPQHMYDSLESDLVLERSKYSLLEEEHTKVLGSFSEMEEILKKSQQEKEELYEKMEKEEKSIKKLAVNVDNLVMHRDAFLTAAKDQMIGTVKESNVLEYFDNVKAIKLRVDKMTSDGDGGNMPEECQNEYSDEMIRDIVQKQCGKKIEEKMKAMELEYTEKCKTECASLSSSSLDPLVSQSREGGLQHLQAHQMRKDFASMRIGASIVSSQISPTYSPFDNRDLATKIVTSSVTKSLLGYSSGIGLPINSDALEKSIRGISTMVAIDRQDWHIGSPEDAISSDMQPGSCWPMAGSSGSITIRLAESISIDGVAVEYVHRNKVKNVSSAPKNFKVYAMNNINTNSKGLFLLDGIYKTRNSDDDKTMDNIEYPESQYFQSQQTPSPVVQYVRFEFLNNHGNPDYTCVYGLRVYAKSQTKDVPPPVAREIGIDGEMES